MFEDRRDAGQQLAEQLIEYKDHPIVLAPWRSDSRLRNSKDASRTT